MVGAENTTARLLCRGILPPRMTIQMHKFGPVLNSRPAGREALLAISPTLPQGGADEILLDFDGVEVLTPSFAEEFVIGLLEKYPHRIQLLDTGNVTVQTTLQFLMRQWPDLMGDFAGKR